MKALILAGGKGRRLRPYTVVIPKPLMPLGDVPILEVMLRQLKAAGVTEIVLAVGYMGHLFEAFFGTGERYGLKIGYVFEESPLGTAGPIALAMDRLGDDFFVMNGDILTTLSYGDLFKAHLDSGAAATISVNRREAQIDFGVIEMGGDKNLDRYTEKPRHHYLVSMGVNVVNAKLVRPYVRAGQAMDIPDLMTKLRNDGHVVRCFDDPCYWLDIGRIDDYQLAQEVFEARRAEFLPPPLAKAA